MDQFVLHDGRILNVHPEFNCYGEVCSIHNPSDHPLREYGLDWHDTWKVMVRVTPDGPVIDPDEYKVRMLKPGESLILENSARCRVCGDKIISTHRHDFVSCSCGKTSVDGGNDYLRRSGVAFFDTSVIYTKGG